VVRGTYAERQAAKAEKPPAAKAKAKAKADPKPKAKVVKRVAAKTSAPTKKSFLVKSAK